MIQIILMVNIYSIFILCQPQSLYLKCIISVFNLTRQKVFSAHFTEKERLRDLKLSPDSTDKKWQSEF